MQNDIDTLVQLNTQIGEAESKGDRHWLDSIIAPRFAFRRADGITIDDRVDFINKVKPSNLRETNVESIDLYGDRAIVKCIVTVKFATGDERFHNLRLFVRFDKEWKLLGWANSPM